MSRREHRCTGLEARNFADSVVALALHKRDYHGIDHPVEDICVALLHDPMTANLVGLALAKGNHIEHPLQFQASWSEWEQRAIEGVDDPASTTTGRILFSLLRSAQQAPDEVREKDGSDNAEIALGMLKALAHHPGTLEALRKADRELHDWDTQRGTERLLAEAEAIVGGKPTPTEEKKEQTKKHRPVVDWSSIDQVPKPSHSDMETTMFGGEENRSDALDMIQRRNKAVSNFVNDANSAEITQRVVLLGIALASTLKEHKGSKQSLAEIGQWIFRQIGDGSPIMKGTWQAAERTFHELGLDTILNNSKKDKP